MRLWSRPGDRSDDVERDAARRRARELDQAAGALELEMRTMRAATAQERAQQR